MEIKNYHKVCVKTKNKWVQVLHSQCTERGMLLYK